MSVGLMVVIGLLAVVVGIPVVAIACVTCAALVVGLWGMLLTGGLGDIWYVLREMLGGRA